MKLVTVAEPSPLTNCQWILAFSMISPRTRVFLDKNDQSEGSELPFLVSWHSAVQGAEPCLACVLVAGF